MFLPRLFWVWLLLAGTRGQKDGDMRLANGDSANEGRVEIFYQGQWGTVCDNLWDLTDASVVCRALGFENATQALGGAAFGQGTGPIMLDEVVCTGSESSLAECRSLGWLRSNCRHKQDASVICTNETSSAHTLDLSGELSWALGQLFDSQQGCDLFIQVRGQEEEEQQAVCAHTLILAANPEAQALQQEPGSNITMKVDSECMPQVQDFLRYLYSRRIEVTLTSVKCMHKLASAYEAHQLQDFCGRLFATLLPQDPSFWTPLDLYAYALATKDAVLEELCVQYLAWNFEALTQAEAWPSVSVALLRALLARSELAVSSELALLQAVDAWSREAGSSPEEVAGLLEAVRFPMLLPAELFELRFNLSVYGRHEALFRRKMLQALQFHTVPLRLLARDQGFNLTDDAYMPRLYTSATWSASVSASSSWGRRGTYPTRGYSYQSYSVVQRSPRIYGTPYYPSVSFQTPPHPSFLFRAKLLPWSLAYLPSVQRCWDYGFSCSAEELPVLGLTKAGSSDPTIGYENKALTICGGRFIVDVTDFQGAKAALPSVTSNNSSRRVSPYPCPSGSFSSFKAVVRPFYLTNTTGLH
ncbi:galectin-3-binding protein isoform X2 [Ochotona princeps]|nr:galectin-3-binding protein isoform X2 [Ochotona princeps]